MVINESDSWSWSIHSRAGCWQNFCIIYCQSVALNLTNTFGSFSNVPGEHQAVLGVGGKGPKNGRIEPYGRSWCFEVSAKTGPIDKSLGSAFPPLHPARQEMKLLNEHTRENFSFVFTISCAWNSSKVWIWYNSCGISILFTHIYRIIDICANN